MKPATTSNLRFVGYLLAAVVVISLVQRFWPASVGVVLIVLWAVAWMIYAKCEEEKEREERRREIKEFEK